MQSDAFLLFLIYIINSLVSFWWWLGLRRWFSSLADQGYFLSKLLSSVITALVVWNVSYFIKVDRLFLSGTILLFIGLVLYLRNRKDRLVIDIRVLGVGELIGLVIFVGYGLVRGYQPDILGLEKFMDFGFMKSYSTSNLMPGRDIWWANGGINYYSFGHFWASLLASWWFVPLEVSYNIMLSYLFSLSSVLVFSLMFSISKTRSFLRRIFTGLIGLLLTLFAGNSHTAIQWLLNLNLKSYWYADATRFIPFTIHEFPSYSFVVSDLHGHVLSLPMVFGLLTLVFVYLVKPGGLVASLIGVFFGLLMMTNTWDVMIYGMMLIVTWLTLIHKHRWKFSSNWWHIVVALVAGILGSGAWFANFQSIASGLALVADRSDLVLWLTLWAGHLWLALMALTKVWRMRNFGEQVVFILIITGIVSLLIPELIYFRDIYPNHPRANTMFKFTYQGFIMLSLVGAYYLGERAEGVLRKLIKLISAMVAFGLIVFPFTAYPSYYNSFKEYKSLDGTLFLDEKYAAEKEAIKYMSANKDDRNMIEAVGDSYTEYNFVSVFSGVPTVVGWRVHEWLWRGGYEEVGKRADDVRKFYETTEDTERLNLVNKYNIGYVLVSDRERQAYKVNDQGILVLAVVVYEGNGVRLYRINF